MAPVTAYCRPRSLDEALAALARPTAVAIGGGTAIYDLRAAADVEVVDLQAVGFDVIEQPGNGTVVVGSTATLQQVADDDRVPTVVRDAARREQPSTLRNQATVGGCIATGDGESELLASLLAHDAVVTLARDGTTERVPLDAVLVALPLGRTTLVTAVTIQTGGVAAVARTARTPADRPIVAAVGRSVNGVTRIAVTGVGPRPVVVTSAAELTPPGDFRGSGEYRAAVADVLLARVGEALR